MVINMCFAFCLIIQKDFNIYKKMWSGKKKETNQVLI